MGPPLRAAQRENGEGDRQVTEPQETSVIQLQYVSIISGCVTPFFRYN
jgi:hypothetical protein